MKTILLNLLFLSISLNAFSQIKLILPENYYTGYFLQMSSNECYAIDFEPSINLLDSMLVYNDFIELKVIPFSLYTNLLRYDDEGVFLPYDLEEGEMYRKIMKENFPKESNFRFSDFTFSNIDFIDTIDILRDKPSRNPAVVCGDIKKREIPFEYFRFYTIDTTRFGHLRFEDKLITIHVEVKDNDIISNELRRRIVCPNEIDRELIKELNQRLIDLGYLKDEYRRVYAPEIKNAIDRFQSNRNLPVGFLDHKTLKLLKVKSSYYNRQLFTPVGIDVPKQ